MHSHGARRLAARLFPNSSEVQEKFLAAQGTPAQYRTLLKIRDHADLSSIEERSRPTWLRPEFLCVGDSIDLGMFAPHTQGCVYALDLSSAFVLTALGEVAGACELVFDLCAAPGGKAIGAWKILSPQMLVCNEVIGKRHGALVSNLRRCQVEPVSVIQLDPAVCATQYAAAADLVIADVPCSGQSLEWKGQKQAGAFHRHTIDMNTKRQRRIVINGWGVVAPERYFLYSTCTFSPEENERVIEWLRRKVEDAMPQRVPALEKYQSGFADFPCYRLYPHYGEGAGAFVCLLRKGS